MLVLVSGLYAPVNVMVPLIDIVASVVFVAKLSALAFSVIVVAPVVNKLMATDSKIINILCAYTVNCYAVEPASNWQ